MARHRSFGSEFKRQLAKEFLDGRPGLHELARRHSLSRNLIRLWVHKYEAGEFTDELAEAFSVTRGCRVMKLARSTYYYRDRCIAAEKKVLRDRVEALCAEFPRD